MNVDELNHLQHQFQSTFESLITIVNTTKEHLGNAKSDEIQQDSKILEKKTNCKLPLLFLSNKRDKFDQDIRVFIFFNRIYVYIPLILPEKGWKRASVTSHFVTSRGKPVTCSYSKLFPFSSKITLQKKLNSEYLGIWVTHAINLESKPSILQISQNFIGKTSQTGTLSEQIILKKCDPIYHYSQSSIKDGTLSDCELYLTFVLFSWPQANVDPNVTDTLALLDELESNQRFKRFTFSGWNMYFINSFALKAFIYYPISKTTPCWTIYGGNYEMPHKIYFTANTSFNLQLLMNRIKWFNGKSIQIHTVL